MPKEFAIEYRKRPLASSWYSMEMRVQILIAMDKLYAKGSEEYFFEVGVHQAEHNIKNYYRTFMRMIGPKRIMSMAPLFWGLIYKTSRIELVAEESQVEITVFDYPEIGEYNCIAIRGYLHRTAEMSSPKRRNVQSREVTCLNRGDSNCKYVLSWEKA
jgi:predicted hydrocarbon binding protein